MKRDLVVDMKIKSIWYWVFSSKLEIEFNCWDIIQFKNVPLNIFEWFNNTKAYFKYYQNNIKWIFETRIVDNKF